MRVLFASNDELPALLLGSCNAFLVCFHSHFGMHCARHQLLLAVETRVKLTWTHQGAFGKRIANAHLSISLGKLLDNTIRNSLVKQQTACGRASLACGTDSAEEGCANGKVEVCIRQDYDCVVSTELENQSSEADRGL